MATSMLLQMPADVLRLIAAALDLRSWAWFSMSCSRVRRALVPADRRQRSDQCRSAQWLARHWVDWIDSFRIDYLMDPAPPPPRPYAPVLGTRWVDHDSFAPRRLALPHIYRSLALVELVCERALTALRHLWRWRTLFTGDLEVLWMAAHVRWHDCLRWMTGCPLLALTHGRTPTLQIVAECRRVWMPTLGNRKTTLGRAIALMGEFDLCETLSRRAAMLALGVAAENGDSQGVDVLLNWVDRQCRWDGASEAPCEWCRQTAAFDGSARVMCPSHEILHLAVVPALEAGCWEMAARCFDFVASSLLLAPLEGLMGTGPTMTYLRLCVAADRGDLLARFVASVRVAEYPPGLWFWSFLLDRRFLRWVERCRDTGVYDPSPIADLLALSEQYAGRDKVLGWWHEMFERMRLCDSPFDPHLLDTIIDGATRRGESMDWFAALDCCFDFTDAKDSKRAFRFLVAEMRRRGIADAHAQQILEVCSRHSATKSMVWFVRSGGRVDGVDWRRVFEVACIVLGSDIICNHIAQVVHMASVLGGVNLAPYPMSPRDRIGEDCTLSGPSAAPVSAHSEK